MIRVLPEQISNLIAAGEVVQRPASVVKELMENAVDAGATRVQIIIADSGRTLIQVLDNGCGMSPDEAELSFQRHATSKIANAQDLHHILTYGFRGEALASIAACAQVTMITRREEDETATKVTVAESRVNGVEEVSAPKGTNIAVRNLFYNVPARRKFLKSDATEMRQIVQEFSKVAITRLHVEFKLIHNDKIVANLNSATNLKQRIVQLDGMAAAKDLVDINVETEIVTIKGFVGNPMLAKKSQQNQYMFANGRYFRSALFNKAVMKAYDKLVPEGSYPSYYLLFEVNPEETDVNIHPAKTEIKFENESVIFNILNCAVREAVGVGAFVPGINFEMDNVPELPAIDINLSSIRSEIRAPKIDYNPLFNPFDEERNFERGAADNLGDGFGEYVRGNDAFVEGYLKESNMTDTPHLVIGGRFIATTLKSGLALIDIRRAKERILFERYRDVIKSCNPVVQESLFPKSADLSTADFNLLIEHKDLIASLGFDLRPFGENCVVIYGIPAILADDNPDCIGIVEDLVSQLYELEASYGGENAQFSVKEAVLEQFRERAAIRIVQRMGMDDSPALHQLDAQLIIDSLFACDNPYTTPSGRRCVVMIATEELEKRFRD